MLAVATVDEDKMVEAHKLRSGYQHKAPQTKSLILLSAGWCPQANAPRFLCSSTPGTCELQTLTDGGGRDMTERCMRIMATGCFDMEDAAKDFVFERLQSADGHVSLRSAHHGTYVVFERFVLRHSCMNYAHVCTTHAASNGQVPQFCVAHKVIGYDAAKLCQDPVRKDALKIGSWVSISMNE